MSETSSNDSPMTQQQPKTPALQCKVCGASAKRYYLSVPTCPPCKNFFKRNVEQKKQKVLQCVFNGHCEINVNNRHICSCCRLRKRFDSGMQIEMLRCSYSNASKRKRRTTTDTTSLAFRKPEQLIPTRNILVADQSTLSVEQWNLLSNLTHCYDEYSGFVVGEEYAREQNRLPLKLRFKSASLIKVIETMLNGTRRLYQNNLDFRALSSDDRSTLVQRTMAHTSALSTNFIAHRVRLTDSSAYFNAIGVISHPSIIPTSQRMARQLNLDMTVIKLLLAILSFSTITYTFYSNTPPQNLSNIKQILHIQNTYADLLWRYLVYEYNYEQAVRCFSNIVRCLFAVNECAVRALDVQWYTDAVHSVVEQTKQSLNLDN